MKKDRYFYTLCHSKKIMKSVALKPVLDYYRDYLLGTATLTRESIVTSGIVDYSTTEYYNGRTKTWGKEYCEIF